MEQSRLNNGHHANPLAVLPLNLDDARQKLATLNVKAISFVKERPVAALLGALCVGFVVGRIASRR